MIERDHVTCESCALLAAKLGRRDRFDKEERIIFFRLGRGDQNPPRFADLECEVQSIVDRERIVFRNLEIALVQSFAETAHWREFDYLRLARVDSERLSRPRLKHAVGPADEHLDRPLGRLTDCRNLGGKLQRSVLRQHGPRPEVQPRQRKVVRVSGPDIDHVDRDAFVLQKQTF